MCAWTGADAAWELPAAPSIVGPIRRRAAAFAQSVGASGKLTHAVELRVSETVTNVVIHALRRVTAEVAGDAEATTWLRRALPPAKPGTATWAALREGGARLVVHDPSVARSPGGTGERLGLAWWVSVPLEGPDGAPTALWGFGARLGRRPIPSADVMRALAEAGRSDLTQETQQAVLRARLALGACSGS